MHVTATDTPASILNLVASQLDGTHAPLAAAASAGPGLVVATLSEHVLARLEALPLDDLRADRLSCLQVLTLLDRHCLPYPAALAVTLDPSARLIGLARRVALPLLPAAAAATTDGDANRSHDLPASQRLLPPALADTARGDAARIAATARASFSHLLSNPGQATDPERISLADQVLAFLAAALDDLAVDLAAAAATAAVSLAATLALRLARAPVADACTALQTSVLDCVADPTLRDARRAANRNVDRLLARFDRCDAVAVEFDTVVAAWLG
ncbi:hypothetical protein HK405_012636 [Cladochytrium tenue]|nr:hypothetical protein HK405_012636 [Cladochytrium tenue]